MESFTSVLESAGVMNAEDEDGDFTVKLAKLVSDVPFCLLPQQLVEF